MSTINSIPFRSTIFYTPAGVPAATGSVLTIGANGISGFTTNLGSTTVSIGASTNQTYNNFSNGSYAPVSWITAKEALSSTNKTVMSANGLYQMIVGNTTSGLFLSSDSGITWTTLTGGLPTLTGSAYWSDGAISANGQYITLSIYGGSLWMSADYGRTFALTNQPTPSIWLPLNGNVSDSMGLSVVTTPGTVPGYVTVNYPGYTAQAVNLANTAGSTATRYIRGTWSGAANFTVSGWFNPQALTGVYQVIFSTYSSYCAVLINPSNQLTAIVPSGGGLNFVNVGSSSTLSINTWYYFSLSFQTNGTCSLYLNNTLLGSITNTQGVASLTTSIFGLSGYEGNQSNAFNGYIDDLRITNSVSTYVPIPLLQPNIWMPFENSAVDLGSNAITPTVTGSLSYVPGVVGLNAVNLANTAGGTATNFITVPWSVTPNFTISMWFNLQSVGGSYIELLSADTNGYLETFIVVSTMNVHIQVPGGGTQIQVAIAPVVLNTWYHLVQIFQTNGTCSVFLNGVSIGSATNTSGTTGSTWTNLTIGRETATNSSAFNGYIDDLRIYNAAIPIHQLLPQNYRSLALSGSGQYALASAASGWVVGSSNWSQTWSRQAVNVGTQSSSLSLNHTGQYQLVATGPASGSVMPNQTGLAATTWTQGGVNWGASASSTFIGYPVHALFNNTPAAAWLSAGSMYNTTSGAYASTTSTTILGGVGAQTGEWVQIQSSVPLVLQSYTYGDGGGVANMPKTYYIVGSNDGSTWFPLQFVTMTTNPFTTSTYTIASTSITLNTTGAITIQGNVTGQGTSTAYTFSTQPYMYFRMVITSLWASNAGYCEFTEWSLNFSNSVSYSSNYGATWLNTSSTVSNESVALSPSGQYALSTNSVAPFARLTLDNTNVDAQGVLVPTTGAGTVTYSTSIKAVGTHSGQFVNTAGGTPSVYLNYTVPIALNTPSTLTMACWVYPSTYGVASNSYILNLGSTSQYGCTLGFGAAGEVFSYTGKTSGGAQQTTGGTAPLNTWTHVAMTYNSNLITLYVNSVVSAQSAITGNLSLVGGGNITNLLVGCSLISQALNGYVDDVRIYTSALSATAISTLYNNPTITLSQIVAVSNSYLPITSYTFPALSGLGTATVVDIAVSQTGQYMVAVTSSTTNNVYYSTDFGATFTALTIGSSAMVSCSISYDGSYLTVTNATTTYTLNENTRGFTLAIGNQAGRINQGLNAIAIGDKAGQTNQSNNSIVLNATGAALDAVAPGFYVAPVAMAGSSSAAPFNLLGYGTDNQIVQSSSLTVLQNGNVSVINNVTPLGTTAGNLTTVMQIGNGGSDTYGRLVMYGNRHTSGSFFTSTSFMLRYEVDVTNFQFTSFNATGVGIGVTNPFYPLSVAGHIQALNTTNDVMGLFSPSYGNFLHIGAWNVQGSTSKNIVMNYLGGNVGIGDITPIGKLSVTLDGNGSYNPGLWSGSYALFGPGASSVNGSAVGISWNTIGNYGALVCLTAGVLWRDMYYSANQHFFFSPGSTERMRITTTGNVGIGTNPGFQLHLSTDSAAKPSTNTWTISSDERLKENIVLADVDRCVEIIRSVPLKHYRWKDEVYTLEQVKDRSKLGWIAQDVERIFPKAVGTHVFRYNQVYEDAVKEDGTTEKRLVSEDVIEDCRNLNADQLYAVMYGAIQKLISENDLYKTTNIAIHEQFAALQARMDALEARLAA